MDSSKLFLEVTSGVDHGARISLDASTCIIGRARECDLVVRDLTVSRRHAIVTRTTTGSIHLQTCKDASPAIVKGDPRCSFELEPGTEFFLGDTMFALRSSEARQAPASTHEIGGMTERRGVGVKAWHLTALEALLEMLDKVDVVEDLESRMRAWCVEQSMATDVRLDSSANCATTTSISKDDEGMVHVTVPMPDGSAALIFTCRSANGDVPDSLRRALVMAGGLFASALTRTRRLHVVADDVAVFRVMSIGSARQFLGSSAAARKFARRIPQLAASDDNVLLEGETGSGKSFVARLIYEHGPRAKEALRIINCAAIPETLIESELFGHERGAFTGASASHMGALEEVGGGTLLLDEIGELPLSSQTKLLHVLEDRRFNRLGSHSPIPFKARVICATNRDLEKMISVGEFREDLFFRISALRACIPALRERREDVLLLANHILRDLAASMGKRVEGFDRKALGAIARYAWPGNVRELHNAIGYALTFGTGRMIKVSDLPPVIAGMVNPSSTMTLPEGIDLRRIDRRTIEAVLAVTNGNRTQAAELLGISRQTIYNKLAESESEATEPPGTSKKSLN